MTTQTTQAQLPQPIVDRYQELVALVEANPIHISVMDAANFLHMDKECLRASIDQGRCPFAIGTRKHINAKLTSYIETLPFFAWMTNGSMFQTLRISAERDKK